MRIIRALILFLFTVNAFAICDGTVEKTIVPDPVNKTNFEIEARVYRPLAAPFPVVFILPPIVGETPLDGALGLTLCLNGIGAYVLDVLNDPPREEEIRNLNVHEDGLIRAEVALNALLEKLSVDPGVSQSYGILGASQGGIISAYLAGASDKLKATVLMASGGDVPEILSLSEQESVKTLREDRMKFFKLKDRLEYKNLIAPFITLDPLNVARFVRPNSMLLFVVTNDVDVPTKTQRLLARSLRGPQVIDINNTHVPGIIEASTRYSDRIIRFFKSKL